jgi:hypothetical protein
MRFLVLACLAFIAPLSVSAQFSTNSLLETNLSVTSQPEYPSPFEEVDLSLNDYGGSAYGATIEWYKNDTLIPGSTNQRNISVTVGGASSKTVVKAVLVKSDGGKTVLSKTFEPVFVDIVVEAETHVPGFYEGRALPSIGSNVYLTALLDNGTSMGENFVYLWRVNQTVLEGGPLRGRNTISFIMPQDSYSIVSLQISKPDGTILAKRSTIVSGVAPQLHFYEVSALYGTEVRSLSSFNMIGSSATLIAEPYYLDSRTFNAPNLIEWTINNQDAVADTNPYSISLEKTGNPGRARLEFRVQNTTSFLQGANKSIDINI